MFTKTWALDAIERLAKTFCQVFLAQLLASGLDLTGALTDTSSVQRAAVAGIGAVLSLVTSALSSWSADPGTASIIPGVISADAHHAITTGDGAE